MSFSMLYELIEWGAAVAFGGDLRWLTSARKATPGDAQKDMALASPGALLSMSLVALINWNFDANFGTELRDSLTPMDTGPLGEQKLRELMQAREPSN